MGSNIKETKVEIGQGDSVAPVAQPSPSKAWVHFEEESGPGKSAQAAVITTESVQVNLERSVNSTGQDNNAPAILDPKNLRNVELPTSGETIRQGFNNGDIIVTLLPVNTRFPWVTPAQFRPELVPEELMAQGLTLTVEEYVQTMELLVNDYRFTMYNICYKRVLVVWITLAFCVLLSLLFSGLTGLTLFGLGIGWLILNAAAIFFSMWIKFKLARNLERCLAHVNKQLLRHKIVLALDDRGKISCHKVTLCFIYLDPAQCIDRLQTSVEQQERDSNGWEQRMDISAHDIVIQGSRTTRLSRKQGRAEQVFTRYLQRWGKDFLRRRLDWTLDEAMGNPSNPRHITTSLCPCQYIEDLLANKPPRTDIRDCCPCLSSILERATLLYLRYASRWGKDRVRGYLASPPAKGGRHCANLTCPCQYIDDHLQCKPAVYPCSFCVGGNDPNVRQIAAEYQLPL